MAVKSTSETLNNIQKPLRLVKGKLYLMLMYGFEGSKIMFLGRINWHGE